MNAEIQTLAALALVAIAATWLVLRGMAKKKSPGCGGDCGCASQKIPSPSRRP
jgi:FeoB-associated Cys-rich membrane protein